MHFLRFTWCILHLLSGMLSIQALIGANGSLEIRDGYLWDPVKERYFVGRGIAYQTWNPPVFADQSRSQVEYDFLEFKKIHVNSVRVDFVWSQLEVRPDVYDWSNSDFLVALAEKLDLKLFVVIGYQYPPDWFNQDWYAVNDQNTRSNVLNYNHPSALRTFREHISKVVERYRDSKAIGGWILGNEFAYFDLWEDPALYSVHRFLGYDDLSLSAFRDYLENAYHGDIEDLNRSWGTGFSDFTDITMPGPFPEDRRDPRYPDLIRWRQFSIADFIAQGAVAAKQSDPNHLITYSMVGGIFSGLDANNTAEDDRTIVGRCRELGAPLDFWSINNYGQASLGNELRTADFGVAKYQEQIGLPILVSETGHTSTETIFPGAAERQPQTLPGQIWESLMSGVIGTHIFHWNDRQGFTENFFLRERGFGFTRENRLPKQPVYDHIAEMFRVMHDNRIDLLLGGSRDPSPEVLFFWSDHSLLGWPSANQENARCWGVFKRAGYQPGIISDADFADRNFRDAQALFLSRSFQLEEEQLSALFNEIIPMGIHLHANADLPGRFDAFHRENPGWVHWMRQLFGLDTSQAVPGFESMSVAARHAPVRLVENRAFGPFSRGYEKAFQTWKIWHGLRAEAGESILIHNGSNHTQPSIPALHFYNPGAAKTAVNTFAIGDLVSAEGANSDRDQLDLYDLRFDLFRAVYRDYFNLQPKLDLQGSGAEYVFRDYRICKDGGYLISLMNGVTTPAHVALSAGDLIAGKTVEDLTHGKILTRHSDGTLPGLTLEPDDFLLLYAYPQGQSLIQPSEAKIYIESSPNAFWPNGRPARIETRFDVPTGSLKLQVSIERTGPWTQRYGASEPATVSGTGRLTVEVPVPDANLMDPFHLSSRDGAEYLFKAQLLNGKKVVSETDIPVRMLWGIRPRSLPEEMQPGKPVEIALSWQELPSSLPDEFGLPLSRPDLWESSKANREWYRITLDLQKDGLTVDSDQTVTTQGTGTHTFQITPPENGGADYSWFASVVPAKDVFSRDVFESFEEREMGARVNSALQPWWPFLLSENAEGIQLISHGITVDPYEGRQSAFIQARHDPKTGGGSFGITRILPQLLMLPDDSNLRMEYTFQFAFKEKGRKPGRMVFELGDAYGNWVQWKKAYQPRVNEWNLISGDLDSILSTDGGARLDATAIQTINVRLEPTEPGVYEGFFDAIEVAGPGYRFTEGFETFIPNRFDEHAIPKTFLAPWQVSVYSENTGDQGAVWQNEGVRLLGSDGSKSAFLVVRNGDHPGSFSGFSLTYVFPETWALPEDHSQWEKYHFSFDFKNLNEVSGESFACDMELQILSETNAGEGNAGLVYRRPYTPDGSWQSIGATLAEFSAPDFFAPFNPKTVHRMVANIIMHEPGVQYVGCFDNLRFDGPDFVMPPPAPVESDASEDNQPAETVAVYRSDNDHLPDRDGDGIADVFETGTGVFISPMDTGTDPLLADTDGDGLKDGEEWIAGTDLNRPDGFRIERIEIDADGSIRLRWMARAGRKYTLLSHDGPLLPGFEFDPAEVSWDIVAESDGLMEMQDPNPSGSKTRWYRLQVDLP